MASTANRVLNFEYQVESRCYFMLGVVFLKKKVKDKGQGISPAVVRRWKWNPDLEDKENERAVEGKSRVVETSAGGT